MLTPQLRGLVLEEIILILLSKAGYRILKSGEDTSIRNGRSGLEVKGRGEWHQVDALVANDHTSPFLYPIRLGLEAKANFPTPRSNGRVGIEVIRNAVGVVKDLNENYFSDREQTFKLKRYNYVYSIFSLFGFTENAQRYAIDHQIYLIQYYHNRLFENIKTLLRQLEGTNARQISQLNIRRELRNFFENPNQNIENLQQMFGNEAVLVRNLLEETRQISRGSYFGLLNGEYPIHIISEPPIERLDEDEYRVEIRLDENGMVIIRLRQNNLYFELPEVVAQTLKEVWQDHRMVADLKRRNISFITLSGIIGNVRRTIKLILDTNWLDDYVSAQRTIE
ncbi:hypothetical protein APA_3067 [Pseudanabaena sp. lw0831]|uniref:hypothetical protein n=1 Tax=Pseudanabaena sp. lw0831 TaxID=1357935 RepID=UPI001915C677|nr:hypothetical protein [Pseudanabaena sp. lw0831]GBO55016.1 hypothetical protein APA_3067 [Pseudanabaena sp. lw0831]